MIRIFVKPLVVAALLGGMLLLHSCGKDPKHPGLEFMPDMYRSSSYETYQASTLFADSVSALKPVAGTIPRGYDTNFPYPNTNEGYEAAGTQLKSPLAVNDENTAEGKRLFAIYCQHCHGEKGDGNGTLKVKGEKFPMVSYFDETRMALTEGKMFFSITHGKNLMGSHASQVDPNERWKIIQYIKSLQAQSLAEKSLMATDSTTAMSK